jgi:Tetracyclin repressor-like, C-terminal domain
MFIVMATKASKLPTGSKKDHRSMISEAYMASLKKEGHAPSSVHKLCEGLGISEKDFYTAFANLNAVEKYFWKNWIESIITAVTSGKEWPSFSAKERYLAFLFAFTGEALEKRSLLEQQFGRLNLLCRPESLDGLRNSFKDFAAEIISHGMESGEIANRGPLGNFYPEVLYIHWRSVLEFFLKDESAAFEKTDAFIEKTVEFAFDLLRTQAIDSAADLARFLIPQISHFGGKS